MEKTDGSMPCQEHLHELKRKQSRIWTRLTNFSSYDDNRYGKEEFFKKCTDHNNQTSMITSICVGSREIGLIVRLVWMTDGLIKIYIYIYIYIYNLRIRKSRSFYFHICIFLWSCFLCDCFGQSFRIQIIFKQIYLTHKRNTLTSTATLG